ncbi:MAG TPA: glycosyltransferase family 4 protein [Chryseosolibacter sp.]|nr:glycosyltransferase family 4 protein [Chryseosolibacter sp.]
MDSERKLVLGVILPHTKIFGGVKRFFEIANILISKGHTFTVFTPEGKSPDWFPFSGEVLTLDQISRYKFDALFITEPAFLGALDQANTTIKIFYAVLQRRYIRKVAARRDLIMFANSTPLYEYLGGSRNQHLIKCIGGIDLNKFGYRQREMKDPSDPFIVLAYGRFYRKKKGTLMVVKSCERLYRQGYNIKLMLFDSPVDEDSRKKVKEFSCAVPFEFFVDHPVERLPELYYKADLFVSAERNAGWSNTSAEAMACGLPVVATRSGTSDFLIHEKTGLVVWRHRWFIQRAIKRMYHDDSLRQSLAANARKAIEQYSWESLADTIQGFVSKRLRIMG